MRPSRAYIDHDALRHNLGIAAGHAPGSKNVAVIKANAYGHGMIEAARALTDPADALAVAIMDEALVLREAGIAAGTLKVRLFRPFPREEIAAAIGNTPTIAVLDRNISLGSGGVFAGELKSALYDLDIRPTVLGLVAGLGGGDLTPTIIENIARKALERPISSDAVVAHSKYKLIRTCGAKRYPNFPFPYVGKRVFQAVGNQLCKYHSERDRCIKSK